MEEGARVWRDGRGVGGARPHRGRLTLSSMFMSELQPTDAALSVTHSVPTVWAAAAAAAAAAAFAAAASTTSHVLPVTWNLRSDMTRKMRSDGQRTRESPHRVCAKYLYGTVLGELNVKYFLM